MKIVKTAMLMILALSVGVFGVSVIISLAGRDASAPVITSDTDVLEIPCDYTQDQLMAGLFQLFPAQARTFHAFLVQGHALFQRQPAFFQRGHDLLETFHAAFEVGRDLVA